MTPKEYIVIELKSFINDFPQTRVRYEHDLSSETHFVEVVPNQIYHLDADYVKWECNFFDNFINLFPSENVCFISDDAIVGLQNIDFEIYGKEFVSPFTVNSGVMSLLDDWIHASSFVKGVDLHNVSFCFESKSEVINTLSNGIHSDRVSCNDSLPLAA